MHTITQSHMLDSPELVAIANAKRKGKQYMIDGLPYMLGDWQPKSDRVIVTLVPWRKDK